MSGLNNILTFRRRSEANDDSPPLAQPCSAQPLQDCELTALFESNQKQLIGYLFHRLGSHSDARDAAQTAFLRVWQRRDHLHRGNLQAMLFLIARNHATDMLRERKRYRTSFTDGEMECDDLVRDEEPLADRIVTARQQLKLIRTLLDELPEKCRTAFVRYKFEDNSYGDIAASLGVTESMARKYVLRAIAHCAERFAELEGWE